MRPAVVFARLRRVAASFSAVSVAGRAFCECVHRRKNTLVGEPSPRRPPSGCHTLDALKEVADCYYTLAGMATQADAPPAALAPPLSPTSLTRPSPPRPSTRSSQHGSPGPERREATWREEQAVLNHQLRLAKAEIANLCVLGSGWTRRLRVSASSFGD